MKSILKSISNQSTEMIHSVVKSWVHIGLSSVSKTKNHLRHTGSNLAACVNNIQLDSDIAGISVGYNDDKMTELSLQATRLRKKKLKQEVRRNKRRLGEYVDSVKKDFSVILPHQALQTREAFTYTSIDVEMVARNFPMFHTEATTFTDCLERQHYSFAYLLNKALHLKSLFDEAEKNECSHFYFIYNDENDWAMNFAKVEAPKLITKQINSNIYSNIY